ncbi:hypothetical protein CIL05_01105 [Virgibacillus profundi]|uniref:DUF1659 domain-containing protein n=1 Tax=Virgibacillus profundi TaxID=2024555 RepID=A0A2A2IIB9_9BACI|nr:DUF1659 domain-containing protein [Virgibacillus profundi]PAV31282.1 hypothetical protein CIL05_01105 [Virgibacillus profundi]PXY55467.1 DUF1659 domain-containing protein [Virgibacillus profundi]
MAVQDMTNSQLQLVLNDGIDTSTGLPIYKTKSFNSVKTTATADQLYTIAVAFAGLQERNLYNIHRKDSSDIRQA